MLPGGVAMQLFREIGAGRPGLFTHVGLGTFIDPRVDGGRMNEAAKGRPRRGRHRRRQGAAALQAVSGATSTLIRGSFADAHGNISLDQEPANVDIYATALAAHNSRRQGDRAGAHGRRGRRSCRRARCACPVPSSTRWSSTPRQRWATTSSTIRPCRARSRARRRRSCRSRSRCAQVIARRGADELRDGAVLNYGFGIPDGVAKLVAERGHHRSLLPDHRARHLWRRAAGGHSVRLRAQCHRHDRRPVAVRLLRRRRPRHGLPRLRRDRRRRQRQRLEARRRARSAPAASSTSRRMPGRSCSAAPSTPRAPTSRSAAAADDQAPRRGDEAREQGRADHLVRAARRMKRGAGSDLCHRARGVPADRPRG